MRVLALAALVAVLPGAALAAEECVDYAEEPGRLVELEEAAGRGALSESQVACLEAAYAAARIQTTKDKISRVLLVNAYAYHTGWWAELVERHLREVDQSDPNIAYLYAFYLFNREDPDYEAVVRWADVALERKQEWSGRIYTQRVLKLLEARTLATYRMWEAAENARSVVAEDLRNEAKTHAREWLDFARSSETDTSQAESYCISVASRYACGLTGDDAPAEE